MNLLWLQLAFLAGLADIGYNFVTRKVLRHENDPVEFAWSLPAIRSVIFIFALKDFKIYLTTSEYLILASLGLVTFANIFLFMKMHSLTQLSLSTIIVRLRMVWVPLIALILIGKSLSVTNYIGILVMFSAVLLVSSPRKIIEDKAIKSALIFSINTSLLVVLQKLASSFATIPMIILTMSIPPAILLPFFVKNPKRRLFTALRKNFDKKLTITLFSLLTIYLLVSSLGVGGDPGKVTAISQGTSILAVIFGISLLKEKEQVLQKIIGSILAVIGVLLLI